MKGLSLKNPRPLSQLLLMNNVRHPAPRLALGRSWRSLQSGWPHPKGYPRPKIPAGAQEKVTWLAESGAKSDSEFWLDGKLVGRASWWPDGRPLLAVGLLNGAAVGYQLDFHENGTVSYAEPFVDGTLHGLAKQYDERGRLLLVSRFTRGTGTDYWCDQGFLAEEHPLVAGTLSGCQRWWADKRSVYEETGWLDGQQNGVSRRWTDGKLDRGSPKFFVRGERVSKREYLAAAADDPSLPAYRRKDDSPERAVPGKFVELRRRARRLGVVTKGKRPKR